MELRDSHIFERQPEGHYVEPLELDRALIKKLQPFFPNGSRSIVDPACGFGRIVRAAREAGHRGFGYDIAPRWLQTPDGPHDSFDYFTEADYLAERSLGVDAFVMNPPYGRTIEFVEKALTEARILVAAIVPATWINGARTARWLTQTPWAHFWPISPRPSMPPGEYLLRGEVAGGGTKDFAVLVWKRGFEGAPTVSHLFWRD